MSAKEEPRHQAIMAGINSTWNEATYYRQSRLMGSRLTSSSTTGILLSFDTFAMRLAASCKDRRGAANSSLSLAVAFDLTSAYKAEVYLWHGAVGGMMTYLFCKDET